MVQEVTYSVFPSAQTNNFSSVIADGSLTNPNNMLSDTGDANYAELLLNSGTGGAPLFNLTGWDFSAVPNDALIARIRFVIRLFKSNAATGTINDVSLRISNTQVCSVEDVDAPQSAFDNVYIGSNETVTWADGESITLAQLKDPNFNVNMQLALTGNSSNYVRVAFVKIEVVTLAASPGNELVTITKTPTQAASVPAKTGDNAVPWVNVNNALVQDGTVSTAALAKNQETQSLQVSGFNLGLDPNMTIVGIQVRYRVSRNGGQSGVNFFDCYLTDDTTNTETLLPGAVAVPQNLTDVTVGAINEMWGVDWTPAKLNSSNFKVNLVMTSTQNSRTAACDVIEVSVLAETGGGGDSHLPGVAMMMGL